LLIVEIVDKRTIFRKKLMMSRIKFNKGVYYFFPIPKQGRQGASYVGEKGKRHSGK